MSSSLRITRREFLKLGLVSSLVFATADLAKAFKAFAEAGGEALDVPVVWFEAQDCAGDTIAATEAASPDLVEVLTGFTSLVGPGTVKLLFHETIMPEWGEAALDILRAAARGEEVNLLELAEKSPFGEVYKKLVASGVIPKEHTTIDFGKGFVLVLEGSVPICALEGAEVTCMGRPEALYCYIGEEHGEFVTCAEWVRRLLRNALAVVAVGNCACYGGIPANRMLEKPVGYEAPAGLENATGAAGFFPDPIRRRPGLVDVLDTAEPFRRFVYSYGACGVGTECRPAIAVPGCPANGEAIIRTLTSLVLWAKGLLPLPELDKYWRPKFIYGATVHEQCPRAGSYAAGDLRRSPGDPDYRCLFSVGCKGPVANCPWNKVGWVNGIGGPTRTGGVCIACTMPGFSDAYEPFYKPLPAPQPPGAKETAGLAVGAAALGAAVAYGLSKLHEKHVKESREVRG